MLLPTPNQPLDDAEPTTVRTPSPAAPALVLDPTWRAGRKLSEARRQRGWSLEQVAERIRIRREFLEALEDMNVKLLPGKAYAVAFLRSYARELGVDERAIVDQFQDECALSREDATKPIRNPSSKPHRERPWLAAAALVVLAAGFVGLRSVQQSERSAAVAEAPMVGGEHPPVAEADVPEPRVVEVRALSDGWLEARGPDGTVFLSQTLRAGEVYRPDPSPGWTLHALDGGAFEVFVNGSSAGPLGQVGMPVLGSGIDEIQPLAEAGIEPPRS